MTITTERRSFIQGAGLVAAAAAASTATLAASPAFAQNNQPSGARTMPYQAKPLSLDPKSIQGHLGKGSREPLLKITTLAP